MFQLADHLVGIYKTNNRTKNVSLGQSLLSKFEKLEKSLRTSKEINDVEKNIVNKVPDQKKLPENKVLEQKNSPESGIAEKKKSLEIVEDSKPEILQSKLRKSDKSLDDSKDQSTKKSVTFDLSPSENKENTLVPCTEDSAFVG